MTVIKESILLVSEPLTQIINLSIQHGIVPDGIKIARVIPIFIFDDQSLFTNYRPISVLVSFSKFLERSYLQSSNAIPTTVFHRVNSLTCTPKNSNHVRSQ